MENAPEKPDRPDRPDSLAILGTLAQVEGPCIMISGELMLADGTTLNIGAAAKSRSEYLSELRMAGYAVVIYSPEELGTADARVLQNRLVELGNEAISDLQDCAAVDVPRGG